MWQMPSPRYSLSLRDATNISTRLSPGYWQRILQRLTDTQRRIFEALPLDHAVPIDHITREGFSVGEVMAAMTILEIRGLTVTLPGGLYARK